MANEAPLRALSRQPLRVQLSGRDYDVPYAPAREWIEVLGRDPRLLVVHLAPDSAAPVALDLVTGRLTAEDVERASHQLLTNATDFKWWVALKLVASSRGEILGEMTLHGVDPDRVSIGQWCAAVHRILTRNLDKKERFKLDFELELPPDEYDDAWDDEDDGFAQAAKLERQTMKERRGRGK